MAEADAAVIHILLNGFLWSAVIGAVILCVSLIFAVVDLIKKKKKCNHNNKNTLELWWHCPCCGEKLRRVIPGEMINNG